MFFSYPSPAPIAVARWLVRLKLGGIVPTPEAADLLSDRLASRRRAWVCSAPALVLTALSLAYAVSEPLPTHRGSGADRQWPMLLAYLVVSLSILWWHELVCRYDLQTGSRLPRRMTRAFTPTARTVLGNVVAAGIAVAVVLQIVMGVVLFVQRADAAAWVFAATCIAAWSVALVGVARAVNRPTIAVDALSTAVDDRLRSGEAARACEPLVLATLAFSLSEGLSRDASIYFLGVLGPVLVSSLISYGLRSRRWAPHRSWHLDRFTRAGGTR